MPAYTSSGSGNPTRCPVGGTVLDARSNAGLVVIVTHVGPRVFRFTESPWVTPIRVNSQHFGYGGQDKNATAGAYAPVYPNHSLTFELDFDTAATGPDMMLSFGTTPPGMPELGKPHPRPGQPYRAELKSTRSRSTTRDPTPDLG